MLAYPSVLNSVCQGRMSFHKLLSTLSLPHRSEAYSTRHTIRSESPAFLRRFSLPPGLKSVAAFHAHVLFPGLRTPCRDRSWRMATWSRGFLWLRQRYFRTREQDEHPREALKVATFRKSLG